jgi:hypothetical protein
VTQDSNRGNLERVVEALGDIIDELMLVGGSAIGPLITDPAHLLATKIEAFHQRGGGDYLHHDIEDLVTLIDGRPTIADEVLAAPDTVRRHLQAELGSLLANHDFVDRMSGHLGSTENRGRKNIVLARMKKIVGG